MDRDGVPLALDVLDVLGRAEFLQLLRFDDVPPGDDVTTVADRCDQGLVHRVLDRRAGRVWRDDGELVHLLVAQLVPHLRQVALVGADSASLGWITDLIDPVDAARPQQRLVKSLRQVCRHHDQDPVPGRRLRAHPEDPCHVAVSRAWRVPIPPPLPPPPIPPMICLLRLVGSSSSAALAIA